MDDDHVDVQLCPVSAAPPALRTDIMGPFLWVTHDTGAGKSVMNVEAAQPYGIRPSVGSRTGQRFKGTGGEGYDNAGEVDVPFIIEDGRNATGSF